MSHGGQLVPFQAAATGTEVSFASQTCLSRQSAPGTTYPDYKPAPFIVSSEVDGVDMVTVVTEGIFSYCGVKVKIDTDRYLGPETAAVRVQGEGDRARHHGRIWLADAVARRRASSNARFEERRPRHLRCADGFEQLQAGRGHHRWRGDGGGAGRPAALSSTARQRCACASAVARRRSVCLPSSGRARSMRLVVVDDHITGVLSEHQAGKLLDIADTGIKMKGRRSTPGRYFQVADPGTGWGGTQISDPLSILGAFDAKVARPGLTMLMVSTTGEHSAYYELDEALRPIEKQMPMVLQQSVDRIQENCEPALCTVLFMGGAGGSLRAGVTDNPVRLTRSVKDALTRVTSGGAPVYVWPGGGITFMVDVTQMPAGAFGYVPTPALVAPIEFTLRLSDYAALGGHMDYVRPLSSLTKKTVVLEKVPTRLGGANAKLFVGEPSR